MESNNGSPAGNGSAHTSSTNGTSNSPQAPADADAVTARAEEIVDRWANHISQFTSVWGRRAYRAAARVREEAQDFWAEAQSIRRGDQS
jgi:hypothetical protein